MKGNIVPFIRKVNNVTELNVGDIVPEKFLNTAQRVVIQEKGGRFRVTQNRAIKISAEDGQRIKEFVEASNELNKYWEEKEKKDR